MNLYSESVYLNTIIMMTSYFLSFIFFYLIRTVKFSHVTKIYVSIT